ncbi:anaphase-promoting complex, subunit 10/DOC domain-containing protein [Cladochytrium replicatum]|nr:anaphase-promoting complex, subunit 10/DOC domain-containing protein [Cladochytrium replicatum]
MMTVTVSNYNTYHEVGSLAVWSVSTCKIGFGVEQLRDDSIETYWQSDGSQPHLLTIQFPKRMNLVQLSLYLDYKQDESYTPSRIRLRSGTSLQDLQDLQTVDFLKPVGWVDIALNDGVNPTAPLRTNIIQIVLLVNHENGRDSHIRLVKIFAPNKRPLIEEQDMPPFSSSHFRMQATLR